MLPLSLLLLLLLAVPVHTQGQDTGEYLLDECLDGPLHVRQVEEQVHPVLAAHGLLQQRVDGLDHVLSVGRAVSVGAFCCCLVSCCRRRCCRCWCLWWWWCGRWLRLREVLAQLLECLWGIEAEELERPVGRLRHGLPRCLAGPHEAVCRPGEAAAGLELGLRDRHQWEPFLLLVEEGLDGLPRLLRPAIEIRQLPREAHPSVQCCGSGFLLFRLHVKNVELLRPPKAILIGGEHVSVRVQHLARLGEAEH
mmetsp:Transcript_16060/g.38360  ORF Transcript_16060/g.38360 Transcript_16060/m.38360 type:complete len:251 (+) Transcript_16060:415-1167(+)